MRSVGLPWLVFLDGEGKQLASAPFGLDLVNGMLRKVGLHLTEQEVGSAIQSLEEATKKK